MKNVLRVTWMVFWRVLLLSFIFGIFLPIFKIKSIELLLLMALIFGIILNTYKRTLSDTPLKDLAKWQSPIVLLASRFRRTRTNVRPYQKKQTRTIINKASASGKISGYEPRFLDKIAIPRSPLMRGRPGKGLSSATSMTASRIQAGQIGEENFSKALAIYNNGALDYKSTKGLINSVYSFWSVGMPDSQRAGQKDSKFDTDIDCIIVGGRTIVLVDIKFYKSGDVTYKTDGSTVYAIDNKSGSQVGDSKKMSQNMKMAHERFSNLYPRHNVISYVVLMPTNSGAADIEKIMWPGNIPFVSPDWAIEQISHLAGQSADQKLIKDLTKLLK